MTGSDIRRLATYDHDEDRIFVAVASCGISVLTLCRSGGERDQGATIPPVQEKPDAWLSLIVHCFLLYTASSFGK